MPSTPTNADLLPVLPEEAVLKCYEAIAQASANMLAAAQAADWDGLIAAEMVCAKLINETSALSQNAIISEDGNQRRMAIIHRVLADDAQIRNLVQPRLVTLEGFLHGRSNGRRVQNAYRH
jgi:flagellar protein FliT